MTRPLKRKYGLRTLHILDEVGRERGRQDEKFPEQKLSLGTGQGQNFQTDREYAMLFDAARGQNDYSTKYGGPQLATWESVLREEFCEAMFEADPIKVRAELIQVAAVAVRIVENIDKGDIVA